MVLRRGVLLLLLVVVGWLSLIRYGPDEQMCECFDQGALPMLHRAWQFGFACHIPLHWTTAYNDMFMPDPVGFYWSFTTAPNASYEIRGTHQKAMMSSISVYDRKVVACSAYHLCMVIALSATACGPTM